MFLIIISFRLYCHDFQNHPFYLEKKMQTNSQDVDGDGTERQTESQINNEKINVFFDLSINRYI